MIGFVDGRDAGLALLDGPGGKIVGARGPGEPLYARPNGVRTAEEDYYGFGHSDSPRGGLFVQVKTRQT